MQSKQDFQYIPNYINKNEQIELIKYLDNLELNPAPMFKNSDIESRFQRWIANDYFCPKWKLRLPHWEPYPIDNTIKCLIDTTQLLVNDIKINSCLINKYPTGKHFIAPHRDSPDSFGQNPTIVILSLGETRTLKFENDKELFSFDLESGSVFIMSGNSQTDYLHSLEKSDTMNCRYSLTFREFLL
jgi:alkylated DNA repair dioxygenase AlkB